MVLELLEFKMRRGMGLLLEPLRKDPGRGGWQGIVLGVVREERAQRVEDLLVKAGCEGWPPSGQSGCRRPSVGLREVLPCDALMCCTGAQNWQRVAGSRGTVHDRECTARG